MPIGPVMMDIQGTALTAEDKTLLQNPLVGGLIYFARNFESAEQISRLSADIHRVRPELLIAVDQEGGRVQRFKTGFTRLPAMQRFLPLFHKNPQAALLLVKDCGWLMAVELLAVGVDFSFAPVVDVDDCHSEVIADRSFSPSPEEVTQLAGAFIQGMHEAGMATTGKHFPGHGSVKGDSHQLLPQDDRSYAEIEQHDLIPFKQLMGSLDALMPAHIVFSQLDSNPVGFSPYWLETILRQQLGFKGVIFSDDLTMEGAAIAGNYATRAQTALAAGCDMVLVCNSRLGVEQVLDSLSAMQVKNTTRLSTMSARKTWSIAQLQGDERYMKTRALLTAITNK
ncbi:MAG: beta-N-acetylhexosaminidase [Kiritimatiellia bacterium]|jgi:beta-N-acetylhexosaminidase